MQNEYRLPRSTPEAQGIASGAILDFVAAVEEQIDALHSFMLLRHGQVVAEGWWHPYAPHEPHMLFSLSKSFTSTAVGLAVAEGCLAVTDPVIGFFPADLPATVSDNLAAMQVRHLLSMSTGHTEDTTRFLREEPDGNWAKAFLARPVEREPGTHFLYNSGATYMLSAILQKLTGMTLTTYLRPRLFDPLGIDYAVWDSCPRGINVGGWGLWITTDSIARFGQLYLQKGQWQDRQLVPAAWIAEATAKQISNGSKPASDWEQGYGYQFWRCRHNAYRGDGAFGQYCLVMPEQGAVLAITSGLKDLQAPLDIIWEKLLPAMCEQPLPDDQAAQAQLTATLANLALPPLGGPTPWLMPAQVSGKRYTFAVAEQQGGPPWAPKLEALTFAFEGNAASVTIHNTDGEQQLHCGNGVWSKGEMLMPPRGRQPVAVSGAWTADDTYTVQIYYYRTPFRETHTCRFEGEQLIYQRTTNVGFGPTEQPPLVGQAALALGQ